MRRGPLRAGLVALVDHDQVGDLEQARLDRLDLVAHLGRLEHDRRVRRGGDLDLALPGPDGLDEDEVEAGRIEHRSGGRRGRGQTAGVSARRHRADEHVAVAGIGLHPNPVTEKRTAGDRARRIDRDDRHRPAGLPDLRDQRRHERRLARARRPGDPDEMRAPGGRVEPAQSGLGDRRAVLDGGQEPGQRQAVASDRRIGQLGRPRRGVATPR